MIIIIHVRKSNLAHDKQLHTQNSMELKAREYNNKGGLQYITNQGEQVSVLFLASRVQIYHTCTMYIETLLHVYVHTVNEHVHMYVHVYPM